MTSFYQFYESMQESKLNQTLTEIFLTEMPMRPEGSPQQHRRGIQPSRNSNVATDDIQGRNTQKLKDLGAPLSAAAQNDQWQKSVEENPDLGIYSHMAQSMRQDRKKDRESQPELISLKGDRRGGGVLQTNKTTGEEDPESLASKNRGLPELIDRIYFLKKKIEELRPQVQSWYDPKLLEIMHEFIDATTTFNKHSKVSKSDPVAKKIQELHDSVKKHLDKAEYRNTIPQPELNLDDL